MTQRAVVVVVVVCVCLRSIFLFNYVYVCVCAHVCLWTPEEDNRSPGGLVIGGCGPPDWMLGKASS